MVSEKKSPNCSGESSTMHNALASLLISKACKYQLKIVWAHYTRNGITLNT